MLMHLIERSKRRYIYIYTYIYIYIVSHPLHKYTDMALNLKVNDDEFTQE